MNSYFMKNIRGLFLITRCS